ncbi:prolipoprotein diacylglyceryl transferase [Nonomuraea basaltis]|uniref:prolipoprotein diacylglyceryl transferase n=1 Tax=Nonomuraea basaltis TaxID=2495887 RepID=UPI00110C5779|nr:prolipoprotein diacylglyceryl transferase [Nonomuraea basaltis]TMR89515.1 prolipoprotein diacylglyceryl transferase [Nonomuraea basaltis]
MPLASIPSPSQGVWYLGIIPIRAYALCIVLGVIVAVWLSERRWRARGGQKGTIIDIAVPAVIFGLIGGRLYHVITDWQTYFGSRAIKEPYKALFIWEGGLGIWGAVALGAVGVWWSLRKSGISMGAIADTVAPGIAFAQAIGRWGNWFNQELYGSPTTLPWGLEIDVEHGGEPGVLYHPTFLYESLWDVALGFVLIFAGRKFALHHGRLFALYVAGYTLGRFWIEGLRIDPVGGVDHAVTFLGMRINQWTSIVLFVGALIYLWVARNKDGVEVVVPPSDTADPAHPSDQADSGSTDTAGAEGSSAEAAADTGEERGKESDDTGTATDTGTAAETGAATDAGAATDETGEDGGVVAGSGETATSAETETPKDGGSEDESLQGSADDGLRANDGRTENGTAEISGTDGDAQSTDAQSRDAQPTDGESEGDVRAEDETRAADTADAVTKGKNSR